MRVRRKRNPICVVEQLKIGFLCLFLVTLLPASAFGAALQARISAPEQAIPLSLSQAIEIALKNHPAIQAVQARMHGAESGVSLEKTAYLPKLDLILMENRGTRNNVFGQFFPQPIMPSMSGPVIQKPNAESAWGSAAGSLLTWEPFDFGLRRANVNLAKAELGTATANRQLTELNVVTAVSEAFFKALSAKAAVQIQAAKVKRAQVFVTTVTSLVSNGLRPGVDLSRAITETSAAQVSYLQAVGQEKLALAYLVQVMGVAGQNVDIQDDVFWKLAAERTTTPVEVIEDHPRLVVQKANVDKIKSKEKSLAVSYRPKLAVQGAFFGRGSGVSPSGTVKGGADGLVPTRANALVGVSMTFPVMNIASLRAQQRIEQANEQAEVARYNEIKQEVIGSVAQAEIITETADGVAKQTPLEVEAARTSEVQIRARYKTGLANVLEVADAERQLTQAETTDALAKLEVWRSRLAQYLAKGDLRGFKNLLFETEQGAKK